jgi:hypothetical protein
MRIWPDEMVISASLTAGAVARPRGEIVTQDFSHSRGEILHPEEIGLHQAQPRRRHIPFLFASAETRRRRTSDGERAAASTSRQSGAAGGDR